jgi:hypothetical protein
MALSTNINKSSSSNFELVFPKIPTESTLAATDELTINIYSTIIPGVTITMEEGKWMGATSKFAAAPAVFEPWNVSFTVDSNFYNWKVLYKWLMYINNNKNKFAELKSNYAVDATLRVVDNFQKEVFRIFFIDLWITSLNEVSLSYREGEQNLECTASFEYDSFELKEEYYK